MENGSKKNYKPKTYQICAELLGLSSVTKQRIVSIKLLICDHEIVETAYARSEQLMCSQRATCLLVFLNYFSASLIELSHHLLTFLLSYLSMYVLCKTV